MAWNTWSSKATCLSCKAIIWLPVNSCVEQVNYHKILLFCEKIQIIIEGTHADLPTLSAVVNDKLGTAHIWQLDLFNKVKKETLYFLQIVVMICLAQTQP